MTTEKLNMRIEVTKQLVEANIYMVGELLKSPTILNKDKRILNSYGVYSVRNSENTELRQRMKSLRKDTIRLEKLMEMGESQNG